MDQLLVGLSAVGIAVFVLLIVGLRNPQQEARTGESVASPHWHNWQKHEVYYPSLRGYQHVVIKDRCTRDGCRMVKTTTGGPLMLWPYVEIKEEPS